MGETALDGLRVLELGDFISASYATKLLADLGADVIKVEPPGGDSARRQGPFPGDAPHPEKSGLYLFLNANKRSVVLDLKRAEGRALCRELCAWADVVVHNLAPPEIERLGLAWEQMAADQRDFDMVSITVFGYDTPYRDWNGTALTATAASGIAYRIGDPGRAPLWLPYCAADFQGGIHGAIAALLATRVHRLTGEGQHAWLSIVEIMATYLGGSTLPAYVFNGQLRGRAGRHMSLFYPWQVAECADGYFEIITMVDAQWKRFMELMGSPPWSEDERLANRWLAFQWAEELDAYWHPWLGERTKEELSALFRENHIAFQPVNRIDEVVESEHLAARGFWTEMEHPIAGTYRTLGAPYRLSATPWSLRTPPPLLGEHTTEVLRDLLGHTDGELASLVERGVIGGGVPA